MSDFLMKVVKCLDQIKAQGLSNLEYDGKKLKWRNDFAELKKFVEDSLGIKGKWSSPGGGTKRFKEENGQLILNWYFKKQCTLLFQGTEADGLKNKLIDLLAKEKPQSFIEQEGNISGNGGFPDEADSILAVTVDSEQQPFTSLSPTSENLNVSTDNCPCRCKSMATEIEGIKLDIVILQSQMSSESTKTKCTNEEISKLQIELKNEQHKNAILKDRATRAEEERDSLRLALKLLMQDQSVDNINPSTKTKDQGQGNCWNTVPKTRNRTISSNITSNVNGNATGGVAECTCDGSNEGKDKSPASKRQQARVQNNKKTVIVGDSIVKGLQQHKLSKAAKQNVGVKCFPGATVGDMSDYIKPVLRRTPDTVILHVGTNNATNKEASQIVNDIDKLCQEVKEIDPNVEIILSELTNREDNAKAKTTVQELKTLLVIYIIFSLSKVPTLYSKISDTEPKEPSCSIEKIIPQTKCENSITFLQSLKGFRVGHLNIASLVKHVDELKIYLEKEPLDVLSINETRLDETISTDTVSIPGYDMVAKNRNRQGGGVAIYHRSILNRDFNQDLYHALSNLNWEINDPNMLWENFQTTFNYVADIHAPLQSRKVRNRKAPWLTDAIKKSMNRRDYLKKKAIKTNSTACHNAYKSLRNEINKKIMYAKHAKRDYYTNCVDRNRNNTKQMWKHINQIVNKNSRSTNISVLQIDEQVITENETIADLFNEYFTDIGPNLSNQITETNTDFKRYMKFKTQHKFNFENININEVLNALGEIKDV
ncbi:Hypothetical predicted protein [Paramuricea clavata]|uniref:Uncharacterized protein n=1 Tax=Paramuricea clavata TaxID=317549 RepID=A0A7D9EGI4_PARCT|nr:Hypothetical predicted protein [Paramuricea clavata]